MGPCESSRRRHPPQAVPTAGWTDRQRVLDPHSMERGKCWLPRQRADLGYTISDKAAAGGQARDSRASSPWGRQTRRQ